MKAQETKQFREEAGFESQASPAPPVVEQIEFEFDVALSTAVRKSDRPDPASQISKGPLSPDVLDRMNRYWMAANFLTVGQIYLSGNPLPKLSLTAEDIKPRLLGHWGTSAGQSFIYTHLNRLIRERGANVIYIAGPGHGGPALNAHSYLEGTYSEVHHDVTEDMKGMRLLFRQFSTAGGVPSHCGPHVPNSIHEGCELGYSLLHAFGAAFDNPDLLVACVVGDGEAETGPLAGSWKGVKFLNPARDGAVLPILHLNGYKISRPTVEARTADDDLVSLYRGHGYEAYFVEGDDPEMMHQLFAGVLDEFSERAPAPDPLSRCHSNHPLWYFSGSWFPGPIRANCFIRSAGPEKTDDGMRWQIFVSCHLPQLFRTCRAPPGDCNGGRSASLGSRSRWPRTCT